MTPAKFAHVLTDYADFVSTRNGYRMSHGELEELRQMAFVVFTGTQARLGKAKLDGLECVEWVKKYRNDFCVPLREAKDEWDRRMNLGSKAPHS